MRLAQALLEPETETELTAIFFIISSIAPKKVYMDSYKTLVFFPG